MLADLNLDALRKRLKHLKDKEARLAADLAINEHPELEEYFIRITMQMLEVKQHKEALSVFDRPKDDVLRQIDVLERQSRFYEDKLKTIQDQLVKLRGETGEKCLEIKNQLNIAKTGLQCTVQEFKEKYPDQDIDLSVLFTDLPKAMGE